MKYLLIGAAILLTVLIFCIVSASVCTRMADATLALVESSIESDADERLEIVRKATQQWDKYSGWLFIMLHHDQVDAIQLELAELEHFAMLGLDEDFVSHAVRIRLLIEHIKAVNSLQLGEVL